MRWNLCRSDTNNENIDFFHFLQFPFLHAFCICTSSFFYSLVWNLLFLIVCRCHGERCFVYVFCETFSTSYVCSWYGFRLPIRINLGSDFPEEYVKNSRLDPIALNLSFFMSFCWTKGWKMISVECSPRSCSDSNQSSVFSILKWSKKNRDSMEATESCEKRQYKYRFTTIHSLALTIHNLGGLSL